MWKKMLRATNNINSAIELGCNIGLNLVALKKIILKLNFMDMKLMKKLSEKLKSLMLVK